MIPLIFTEEEEKFIRSNYMSMRIKDLVAALDIRFGRQVPLSSMKGWLQRHDCYKRGHNKSAFGFTEEETIFLKDNLMDYTAAQLSKMLEEMFGVHHESSTVKHYINRLGYFKKGHYAKNAIHPSKKPIGTIVKENHKTLIKVDDSFHHKKDLTSHRAGWISYGRYLWEQAYGPLPDDVQIIHLNGDNQDFTLENLYPVTHQQHMYLTNNKWHGLGEITRTGLLINDLQQLVKEEM